MLRLLSWMSHAFTAGGWPSRRSGRDSNTSGKVESPYLCPDLALLLFRRRGLLWWIDRVSWGLQWGQTCRVNLRGPPIPLARRKNANSLQCRGSLFLVWSWTRSTWRHASQRKLFSPCWTAWILSSAGKRPHWSRFIGSWGLWHPQSQ